jgi:hypothetical protein
MKIAIEEEVGGLYSNPEAVEAAGYFVKVPDFGVLEFACEVG